MTKRDRRTASGPFVVFEDPALFAMAIRATGLLLRARWLHLRYGSPWLLARLRRPSGRRPLTPEARARLSRAVVGMARRVPWRSDCLIQALAARLWLDSLGAPAELRLGARREGDAFEAHAWMLSDGEVLTGGRLEGPFGTFSGPAAPLADPVSSPPSAA